MHKNEKVSGNDLRQFFTRLTGRKSKLTLPPIREFKDRETVAEMMSRAEEAAKVFGMYTRGPLKTPDTKLILVSSKKDIDEVFEEIYKTKRCGLDTETTGFDHRSDRVVSYQVSPKIGVGYYFPFCHTNYDGNLDYKYCMKLMGDALADPTIEVSLHNAKFDLKWWMVEGYETFANILDTMLMSYILDENRFCGHGLKELVEDLFKTKMQSFSELGIWEKRKVFKPGLLKDFSELSILKAMPYACADPDYTLRLRDLFYPKIQEAPFRHLFNYVEQPLMLTIARMELKGIKVDREYYEKLAPKFKTDIDDLTTRIQKMAYDSGFRNEPDKKGNVEPFNPGSNPQVVKFTEMLGLTTGKYSKKINKKTKKASMSVDKKGRAKLKDKHPVYTLMDELSDKNKTYGTYLLPLSMEHINAVTKRIHASFHQHVTVTGRLSSSNPNLQNIPKKHGILVRQGFVPEPGYLFIRADYSQIELKIVAHVSKCQTLIDAFLSGEDVHAQVAIKAFGLEKKYPGIKPADLKNEDKPELCKYRDRAKSISFGILYGTTNWGLSQNLGCSKEEAQQLIDDFYNAFPEIKIWIDKTIRFAEAAGYVETLMKRRRRFTKDRTSGMYSFGMNREAQNAPIQGTSADITKWAMIRVEESIKDYDAKLILQVHDELIVEAREDQVEEVTKLMVDAMEEGLSYFGLGLSLPTSVEANIQKAWGIPVTKCNKCNKWAVENEETKENGKKKFTKSCKACSTSKA
jgi:DNA polymerase-1